MILYSVNLQQIINLAKTFYRKSCCFTRSNASCICKDLRSTCQFRKLMKRFFHLIGNLIMIENLFHTKEVSVRDQCTDLFFLFVFQIRCLEKTLNKINMSDTYLEFFQACFLKSIHNHCKHFCICLNRIHTDQLCTKLRIFFQASTITGMIDKCISGITQTNWKILCLKQCCHCSCNGRCNIRAQRQNIPLSIKEFIKISNRCRTDFLAEYIKIFKCRCLYVLISI